MQSTGDFVRFLKVRQFLLWQSLPRSPTGRSCQTPPFLFTQENERLDRKGIIENAFRLQGWDVEALELTTVRPSFYIEQVGDSLFSPRCSNPFSSCHMELSNSTIKRIPCITWFSSLFKHTKSCLSRRVLLSHKWSGCHRLSLVRVLVMMKL